MEQLGSHWTDCHEIWYWCIFRKSVEKIQISLKSVKINGREDQYAFLKRRSVLRTTIVWDRSCREYPNTHFTFSNRFFFENRAVCEVMWTNIVEPGRPQMAVWRMRIACWIPKAAGTHSEYEYLLFFHRNKDCTKAPQLFRYTCMHCLSCLILNRNNTQGDQSKCRSVLWLN
jgi:hypothetical protein